MPLVPVSQILPGCVIRWRLQDWSCYSNTNSLTQTETKKATHRGLFDWSWSQQNREKPKGQLSGDCLTGLGPNRNGENQRGSSPETARLVLVPPETGKTNSSSPETARPVLVTQPKGKTINPWYSMNEGLGGRSHVVNEIQEHTDGVPPGCVSRPGCNSTSFQSESHPVPRGPTDPPGSIIKRQGRNIFNNREQTDNTAALRRRLKRSGQRSAISPLPHKRGQGPLSKSRCLCPRTQRTNRRRDRRRGWTRTLLARDELDGWSGPRL